jgi:thymidylate synthase ThyX
MGLKIRYSKKRWVAPKQSREKGAKMAFACSIVADSISIIGRHRLTTMIITLPRIVLAELNTHRLFSRNSASSRAIPVRKQLKAIVQDTFQPDQFGTATSGMNAGPALEGNLYIQAKSLWDDAAASAVWYALCLTTSESYIEREWAAWSERDSEDADDFDEFVLDVAQRIEDKSHPIHDEAELLWTTKGLTNRLLEPFMWHTVIITATEWENFLNLRTDINAQGEIRTAAEMMKQALDSSTPEELGEGEWHLPFIQPEEKEWAKQNPEIARKAVTARCARVSYLTHDKKVIDLEADVRLADGLAKNGHMSPFEHAATPFTKEEWNARNAMARVAREWGHNLPDYVTEELVHMTEFSANFRGWGQYRREQKNQRIFVKETA